MKRYSKHLLAADFETTVNENTPEVYAWGVMDEAGVFEYGTDIGTFFDYITGLDKNYIMYFHNGAKFDFHFILPKLDEFGFTQREFTLSKNILDIEDTSYYRVKNTVEQRKHKDLQAYEYEIIADGNKKIISIRIGLPTVKNSHKAKDKQVHRILELRDSNLLFVGSIKSYGETLNEQFKTDKYSKLDLDDGYTRKDLYNSVEEFENDGNQLEYLRQDVFVLIEYLKYMETELPREK